MASDNLSQLGLRLRYGKDNTDFSSRRISENFPLIERTADEVAADFPFRQEFYIYLNKAHGVKMTLHFTQQFDANPLVARVNMPITFGVGGELDGNLGTWYPVLFLGDLNFAGSHNYSTILTIVANGSYTAAIKASFSEGEVDLTSLTDFRTNEIETPFNYTDLVVPPATIIHSVTLMLMITSLSGTLSVTTGTVFQDGFLYTPRLIG